MPLFLPGGVWFSCPGFFLTALKLAFLFFPYRKSTLWLICCLRDPRLTRWCRLGQLLRDISLLHHHVPTNVSLPTKRTLTILWHLCLQFIGISSGISTMKFEHYPLILFYSVPDIDWRFGKWLLMTDWLTDWMNEWMNESNLIRLKKLGMVALVLVNN